MPEAWEMIKGLTSSLKARVGTGFKDIIGKCRESAAKTGRRRLEKQCEEKLRFDETG